MTHLKLKGDENMPEKKKISTSNALKTWEKLDEPSKAIATSILQLAVALFMGIQSVQNQNDNRKED